MNSHLILLRAIRCASVLLLVTALSHIVIAEELAGDFNHDGKLDHKDVDALGRAAVDESDDPQFDLNEDGLVDLNDRQIWVRDLKLTWFGDANLNGVFNSGDLVEVLKEGEYNDSLVQNSGWEQGDWNGDLEFGSTDLVLAFQDGGYRAGQRQSAGMLVPEPSSFLIGAGLPLLLGLSRKRSVNNHHGVGRRYFIIDKSS